MRRPVVVLRLAAFLSIALSTDCGLFEITDPDPPVAVAGAIWSVPDTGEIATPVADSALVFFGAATGHVVAIEKAAGTVRWRRTPSGDSLFTITQELKLADQVLLVVTGGQLYGLDRATGTLQWMFTPPDDDQVRGGLAVSGSTVFAGSYQNRGYAVDTRSGALLWSVQLPGRAGSSARSLAVRDGFVFVGVTRGGNPTTGALAALDTGTGATRWIREFDAGFPGAYYGCCGGGVVHGDQVIVSSEDGRIFAFDRLTGDSVWAAGRVHPIPPEPGGTYGETRPLALAGDVLIAGSTRGILVGLDARTGTERWRNASRAFTAVWWPYTTDGQTLYATADGLSAIDVATGAVRWTRGSSRPGFQAAFVSAALPDGDRLYIAGIAGFFALPKNP